MDSSVALSFTSRAASKIYYMKLVANCFNKNEGILYVYLLCAISIFNQSIEGKRQQYLLTHCFS